jgi:aminopeptidase N
MKDASPAAIRLADYTPPTFAIERVALTFDLDVDRTEVEAEIVFVRVPGTSGPLVLDGGQDAEGSGQLLSIAIDGEALPASAYTLSDSALTLHMPKDRFTLVTRRRLTPSANKSLEGLYASGSGLFTQCEAEGFRKITWYLDRPDVMSVFTVTLRADPARFPILLSNGNKVSEADETIDGKTRRVAVWHDPHKKPAYLFAVVAADLVARSDTFTTMSGKRVDLHVWVQAADLDQTAHCMESLKKSMVWDEQRFGREYDLDVFNLVAVSDFNMGAMENKGLNIFNTKYVLARPDTATDVDLIMNWQELSATSHYKTALAIAHELELGHQSEADKGIKELINALSRSEKRALKSQLIRLMKHILKWKNQPDFRSRSWVATIQNARVEIKDIQEETPSLNDNAIKQMWDESLSLAIVEAEDEMRQAISIVDLSWEEVFKHPYLLN